MDNEKNIFLCTQKNFGIHMVNRQTKIISVFDSQSKKNAQNLQNSNVSNLAGTWPIILKLFISVLQYQKNIQKKV